MSRLSKVIMAAVGLAGCGSSIEYPGQSVEACVAKYSDRLPFGITTRGPYAGITKALCWSAWAISDKMNVNYDTLANQLKCDIEVVGTSQSFPNPDGRPTRGMAFCDSRFVRLANGDWTGDALTHELIHISLCPETTDNYAHKNWDTNGAYKAIDEGMMP